MRLGHVDLTVTDLHRSVAFYQDALGLRHHRREDPVAALGAGEHDLVVLHEEPNARPAGRHAGLFHFALLFPDRAELARALQRLVVRHVPMQGASDHGVSEALYLADPDGNGIELYADRPREAWPPPGPGERVGMFTEPLDLESLTALVKGQEPVRHAGPGLVLGHMHLHVGDLEEAVRFYVDEVGLEEMTRYPGAAFLAKDGYHHHLGVNTWRGEGVPPAPPGAVGLREWTLLNGVEGTRRLEDPSGNTIAITGSLE
jgi:catechol 2,3-dioxygenase